MSTKRPTTESREYPGPWVRVRGRLSREGSATFSPCIRTFKGPPERRPPPSRGSADRLPPSHNGLRLDQTAAPAQAVVPRAADQIPPPEGASGYKIVFEGEDGSVLESAPTDPHFYAKDAAWASFGGRLPYHPDTARVVLRFGDRELGALPVTRRRPEFDLVSPRSLDEIDLEGILHLRWRQDATDKKANRKWPLTYFVRFGSGDGEGLRPGVNVTREAFDLDLRGLPGGERCVVQVLATNGYQTSYVETVPFALPRPGPMILAGEAGGPELFAQGFSANKGPLLDEAITWLVDGKERAKGGTFDVRTLRRGAYDISVRVVDADGRAARHDYGSYDGATGLLIRPAPGL
jgi:hypothetical protein